MLGTSLRIGRSHGDDRFYDASKARRSHSQQHQSLQRSGSEEPCKPAAAVPSSPPASTAATSASNLDRFLDSTTPSAPAQHLSKTSTRGWRSCDVEYRPYFNLGDLWESFKEWSAYGAGVPLVLDGGDSVVQYYVPYLSAIQLYGESSRKIVCSRGRPGEESDADSRDSSSDGSSDWELEVGSKYSRDRSRNHKESSSILGIDRISLREKHTDLQDDFNSQDGESGNSVGCLLFEYLEHNPPYTREPLTDKIFDLARRFPKLKTFRSCDLSPASWISVAWYPIYRIPTGPTLKDLDACFLTFHSLSTPMTGSSNDSGPTVTYPQKTDGVPMLSLPVFGLASYKFKGSIWTPSAGSEKPHVSSLMQDADKWLRLLNVVHPDYQFFASRGAFPR